MEEYKRKKIGIDFFGLLQVLRKDKWKTALFCFVFGILGIIVAFSIPRIYKAQVMLAPEESGGSSLGSSISSLASMVGMDMQLGNGSDAIYPEIYPDLMGSTKFLVDMFDVRVKSLDGEIDTNLYDYLKNRQKSPFWGKAFEGIGALLMKLASKKEISRGDSVKVNPFELTKEQFGVAQAISNSIDCSVDKKTSVITLVVTAQDPLICATLVDSVKERLQLYITDYRTNKARNDVAYVEKLFNEAKSRYEKARRNYAKFSDANQELILETYKAEQEDLENEMQLQYNIYTQCVEQLQLSRAKLQEKTPVFTVVQPATVPIKHSNKPKILILFGFMFVGFSIRLAMLVLKYREQIIRMIPV